VESPRQRRSGPCLGIRLVRGCRRERWKRARRDRHPRDLAEAGQRRAYPAPSNWSAALRDLFASGVEPELRTRWKATRCGRTCAPGRQSNSCAAGRSPQCWGRWIAIR